MGKPPVLTMYIDCSAPLAGHAGPQHPEFEWLSSLPAFAGSGYWAFPVQISATVLFLFKFEV